MNKKTNKDNGKRYIKRGFAKISAFGRLLIKNVSIFGLLALMLTGQSSVAQVGPGDWSSVRLYGHAYALNDFSTSEYDFIKNHHYFFSIEKRHALNVYGSPTSEYASGIAATKMVNNNSNTKPLFYWNTKKHYDYIYATSQSVIAQNPDWVNGSDWSAAAYADPAFRSWFVNVVKDQVNNSDHSGVFLDAALSAAAGNGKGYLKDMIAQMPGTVIFNGFGPNNLNFARFDYLEVADGVFLEHFFKSQCDTLAKGERILDDMLLVPNDKIIIANSAPQAFWNTTDHKFGLACFLIIANDNSYFNWMPAGSWSNLNLTFWDADFGKYIGPPTGAATKTGYVYKRTFANASVTVDLANKTSSIVWGATSSSPIGKDIWLKSSANGNYVCADLQLGTFAPLHANRTATGGWEKFTVVDAGNGMVALKANVNGKYVSVLNNVTNKPLEPKHQTSYIGSWEKFTWINNSDGTISLKANVNGNYVSALLNTTDAPLRAIGSKIASWEKFTWGEY